MFAGYHRIRTVLVQLVVVAVIVQLLLPATAAAADATCNPSIRVAPADFTLTGTVSRQGGMPANWETVDLYLRAVTSQGFYEVEIPVLDGCWYAVQLASEGFGTCAR